MLNRVIIAMTMIFLVSSLAVANNDHHILHNDRDSFVLHVGQKHTVSFLTGRDSAGKPLDWDLQVKESEEGLLELEKKRFLSLLCTVFTGSQLFCIRSKLASQDWESWFLFDNQKILMIQGLFGLLILRLLSKLASIP